MDISLSVRTVDQQRRQLAVRFYSKWYCATSGVNALARRFRLASNKYMIRKSTKIKVCPYQVMISNGLFGEIVEKLIFSEVVYNQLRFKFHVYNAQ